MSRIRIVIVDDHEVVRHGLRLSLGLEPDIEVVGEAWTGSQAIAVATETQPDVLLLDVRLQDIDGPEVCRQVRAHAPKTAVLMLTNYVHDDLVLRSLVAGAKGYVLKDVELAELKKMIRSVYRGNPVLDPKIAPQVISGMTTRTMAPRRLSMSNRSPALLSETDIAIIRHLADGLTNKEIASHVRLSPHTVKDHIEKICATLNVNSRTKAVSEALRRGLI